MNKNGMKILTIAPTPYFADRGTHIRILEEARAQVRRGHTVTIATYHIGATPDDEISRRIDVRRIHRWLFWYKKLEAGPDWQKILLDILLARKVLFLALRQRPDVLHAHLHEGVLIAWVVQKLLWWRSMIVVADMHGSLVKEMASHGYLSAPIFKRLFHRVERWVDNMGDVMVTSSWENQTALSALRRGEVHVQPDGVDTTWYTFPRTEARVRALRAAHGVPADAQVIVYTGAMVANKGVEYLLYAIPLVCARHPRAHFVLAGFPRTHVERAVARSGLQERVTIISPLPYVTLPDVLGMADVAVDPKDTGVQQASGKILQYMGAGMPIVCFDKENNRAYLGEQAFYASDISARGLAEAIGAALTHPERCARYAAVVRAAAAQFSWERGADVFENVVAAAREKRHGEPRAT